MSHSSHKHSSFFLNFFCASRTFHFLLMLSKGAFWPLSNSEFFTDLDRGETSRLCNQGLERCFHYSGSVHGHLWGKHPEQHRLNCLKKGNIYFHLQKKEFGFICAKKKKQGWMNLWSSTFSISGHIQQRCCMIWYMCCVSSLTDIMLNLVPFINQYECMKNCFRKF